ncbi:MAG: bifunctional heptose 7-phosphate kinase/heptose 1-phosphate adenyltransferase [Terriglobales bacterium]
MKTDPQAVLRAFPRLTITVWGDFIADEFVTGEITRVSREAPVLILKRRGYALAAGGGANAAMNLAALGVRVRLVGAVGSDEAGRELLREFRRAGLDTRGVLTLAGRPTPAKMRIVAHHAHTTPQQVVRVDQDPPALAARVQARLARAAKTALRGADALLASDYGYGAITPELAAAAGARLTALDCRYAIASYHGVTAATPNESELEAALQTPIAASPDPAAALERAGRRLLRRLGCRHLLVTRGRDGMALFEPGRRTHHWKVFGARQALDVTGAGDTVVAVFTAALAAGADGPTAAGMANCAGGLVVMKPGTATVTAAELGAALRADAS